MQKVAMFRYITDSIESIAQHEFKYPSGTFADEVDYITRRVIREMYNAPYPNERYLAIAEILTVAHKAEVNAVKYLRLHKRSTDTLFPEYCYLVALLWRLPTILGQEKFDDIIDCIGLEQPVVDSLLDNIKIVQKNQHVVTAWIPTPISAVVLVSHYDYNRKISHLPDNSNSGIIDQRIDEARHCVRMYHIVDQYIHDRDFDPNNNQFVCMKD